MEIDITIKNYRVFEDRHPARFTIQRGFISFVGTNNAGKSSILRFFYEFRSLFAQLSSNLHDFRDALRGNPRVFNPVSQVRDNREIFCKFNNRDLEITIQLRGMEKQTLGQNEEVPNLLTLKIPRDTNTWSLEVALPNGHWPEENGNFQDSVYVAANRRIDFSDYMNAFEQLSKAIYIPAFRNAINLGANENYYDIRVGQAFVQNWRVLKTGSNSLDNEKAAAVTEIIRRIFGYDKLEINASEDLQTLQLLIDDKSYGLHELGSGFVHFVLVLINVAVAEPSYVLIDEPELGLHASLQLEFLTTLGTFASQGVMFSTHSLGLARSASELVYSLTRQGNSASIMREFSNEPRLAELLGELSFSGYREIGYDGVLLVEGPTEIKLFHELLRKYGKDRHFVVLPLGGGGLIKSGVDEELSEVKRISDNVVALIDSERPAKEAPLDSQRQAFVDTCNQLKIDCRVLQLRAIENYFSDQAVKRVFGDKYRALLPYEKLSETELGWAKADNWRIGQAMTKAELDGTDLGSFLDSI